MSLLPLPFPPGFLWGASTSSHQVEGGNTKNDWWAWEVQAKPSHERSGVACDQWNRWEEDVALMAELGHNAHRLSLEWSRIEPEEGVFDPTAIEHYRLFLHALRAKGIKTVVTLHHFTNPTWLVAHGGWTSSCVVKRFTRYAEYVMQELGQEVDVLLTINEPGVYAFMSYQVGAWPPQIRSSWKMGRVLWNMARAHRATYKRLKPRFPSLPMGVAQNMTTFEPVHATRLRERLVSRWLHYTNNLSFYWLTGWSTHDLLGLNYYFHRRVEMEGLFRLHFQNPKETHRPTSDLGWELFPEGLARLTRSLTRYSKPVLVTEHGLADAEDSRRPAFLKDSLTALSAAIQDGAPVIGYLHWSLLDNFEWADGFTPRFGLVHVDYETQKRTPRPSARLYTELMTSSSEIRTEDQAPLTPSEE